MSCGVVRLLTIAAGVGRRQPEAAARALQPLIAADPQFVMRTLAKSA